MTLPQTFALLSALLVAWGAWRLLCWFSSGGQLPLRGHRGSARGFTAAGLSLEAFYTPGARQVTEARLRERLRRDDDDEGDSPDPGINSSD
jgi:hypothetical protein